MHLIKDITWLAAEVRVSSFFRRAESGGFFPEQLDRRVRLSVLLQQAVLMQEDLAGDSSAALQHLSANGAPPPGNSLKGIRANHSVTGDMFVCTGHDSPRHAHNEVCHREMFNLSRDHAGIGCIALDAEDAWTLVDFRC